ncbi:carboxypeptidase-like regulatory domain-containing protein [Aureibaculum sp. 2210JD6-5]|uniref:carboxypeptidase-like regulatory domain-containing protein n=1 Tax=Aureibaculum sp. 2210JD6-5 TaxID=3103957 RepID=UPI002AAD1B8A|nr:carboxypeptidase-like regulatory domain-containing protein [Aureibaculum sp. 2210JD6-5]MDY7394007.1 carboxypeptidase-like regulatory domain-containing protein [Aureibaculum sp. 2210JD6-5]
MLRSTCLVLLIISSFSLSAQEARTLISGTIKSNEPDLKDVHVINITSKKGSVTNTNGQFSIWAKNNDTLVFRGLQFESKKIVVKKTDIDNKSIEVELNTRTNMLKEVNIKKPENMAMALNLPNAGKKPLKGVDRKLAYYSQESTVAVILGPLLGKKGGIEDLYNIISGNRKKHRKLKKLIEADKLLEHNKKVLLEIRKHFKDDFFIYTLKIPSKKIDSFIDYCQPKNIVNLFDKKSYLEIIDVFVKESKPFLKDMKDEK